MQQLSPGFAALMPFMIVNEAGETITRTAIFRQERYQRLVAQMRDEISMYAEWADEFVEGNQLNLGKLGVDHAAEAMQLSLMEGEVTAIVFDRLPVSAVETMVGIAGDGGPVHSLLAQAYPMAVEEMTEALIKNTLLGVNPRQTAREMMDGTAAGLNHSLTVARTEQLRVYREAGRQQYETSGLVEGYRRLCAKNVNTCAICLGLDGEVYPTEELMHVHPNDRCSMVPIVEGMPPIEWETGEEWLRKQDPELQEQIMGKGAHELWDAGDIELSDLATKVDHEIWGPSLQRTPLKDLQPDEMFADVVRDFDADDLSGPALQRRMDEVRVEDAYKGVSWEESSVGGMNESYLIDIGGDEEAIFKPGLGENSGWLGEADAEVAFYDLSEELGFEIVPPTTVRKAGTYEMADGTIANKNASLQHWVPDATTGEFIEDWTDISERTYSQMTLMDTLTGNYDRHAGNWLLVDGDLIAIDNGMAFFDMADGFETGIFNDRLGQWFEHKEDSLKFSSLMFHPDDLDSIRNMISNDTFKARIVSDFGEDAWDNMVGNARSLLQNQDELVKGIGSDFDLFGIINRQETL